MASVNDMFNEVTKEQSFYTKAKKKEFTPYGKGEYYGHITDVDSKILDVKSGQYKARLYTYTVEIASKNKDKEFHPHLTVARVKFVENKKELKELLSGLKVNPVEFIVEGFEMIKSEIGREGPVYEVMGSF